MTRLWRAVAFRCEKVFWWLAYCQIDAQNRQHEALQEFIRGREERKSRTQ